MTDILHLPEELLSKIISSLAYDRRSLLNLARVSRRFHSTTRPFIFRHATLKLRDVKESSSSDTIPTSQFALLHRSFRANPSLYKHVRSYGPIVLRRYQPDEECDDTVRLSWNDWKAQYRATSESLHILEQLPNLKKIKVYCQDMEGASGGYVEPLFTVPALQNIEIVKVENARFVAIDSLLVSKVQKLSLYALRLPHGPTPTHWKGKKSTLKKLSITAYDHESSVAMEAIQGILSMCQQLQRFKCQGRLGISFWGYPPPEFSFSTSEIQDAFNHVRTTIEELDLEIPVGGVSNYTGDPIDLSGFHVLKRLRIPSIMLLRMSENNYDKMNIFGLLPRNIQRLHIDFFPATGVAWNFWQERNLSEQPVDLLQVPRERSEWMLQFPLRKPTCFPFLTDLRLEDDSCIHYQGPKRMAVEWRIPEDIRNVFESAGIDLKVKLLIFTE